MRFSHISVGGGITGLETIISAFSDISKKIIKYNGKFKNFKSREIVFAVIDKNPDNIPGGVAYGFKISQYGYFNNPLRLSPISFFNWVVKKENKKKIINYLKKYGGYTGIIWIKKNKKILFSNKTELLKELYIPRTIFNFWMEERLILLISDMRKISKKYSVKFKIKFLKGEVIGIKKTSLEYNKIILKNNSYIELDLKINLKSLKKIKFTYSKKCYGSLYSKTQNLGIGLPPPKQLATIKAKNNKKYIWDFYSEGSTSMLIKKILLIRNKSKIIKIYFIGYKAGLLESLPELKKTIINKKIDLKIFCSSKDLESIQKAELSTNKKKYNPFFFKKNYLNKITTAKKIYQLLVKEFNLSLKKGFNKYDAWTYILKNNILYKCIKNFNNSEKIQYDNIYHHKIRNLTRFTYPETIIAREKLLKMNVLETKKEKVIKVDSDLNKLFVTAKNTHNKFIKYYMDLIINVSGPLNASSIKNEVPLIKSLKNQGAKITLAGGFEIDKYFRIKGFKNVFSPGILSRGFNPERKTIIKAILENSKKCGEGIAKTLIAI